MFMNLSRSKRPSEGIKYPNCPGVSVSSEKGGRLGYGEIWLLTDEGQIYSWSKDRNYVFPAALQVLEQ